MKSFVLVAAILVGSYANALTLKSGVINGKTNLSPSVSCALEIYPSSPSSGGGVNAVVVINGKQQYGFTVSAETVKALKNKSNLKEAAIAGQLERSGDQQLSITVVDNELVSYTYQGISPRTNLDYGVSCLF